MARRVKLHDKFSDRGSPRDPQTPEAAEKLKALLRRSHDDEGYAARMAYLSELAEKTGEIEPILNSVFAQIGSRWGPQIVICLGAGPFRFSTLQKMLAPISKRVLTMSLRGLERDGLISRTTKEANVIEVHYQLTPMGVGLFELMWATIDWVIENVAAITRSRADFDLRNP